MEEAVSTYKQAEEYLFGIPKFTGKNSLEDTELFLKRLGNPERQMKIIHIAGTNGKGSVCAYLCSVLQELGYSVGTFTSPHLVELRERIQINRVPVQEQEIYRAFCRVMKVMKEWNSETGQSYHPSFFEFLFFIAVVIFEQRKPDYVILETGLGGRLDATNSVERPILSVITRIGMDHMQYLGDTIEKIAREKAGIIKTGVPVVFDDTDEKVTGVIEEQAGKRRTSVFPVSEKDYRLLNFKNKVIDFSYYSSYYNYIELSLNTAALYQMENASLALRAAHVLFPREVLSVQVMKKALLRTHWEGRMEEAEPGVYVDGAHNEDGVAAFLESVRRADCPGRKFLILGAVRDKDYMSMFRKITDSGVFAEISVVGIHNGRALTAEELLDAFDSLGTGVRPFPDVVPAFEYFKEKMTDGDRIYIAGSLYLAGEFKKYLRMRGSHD